MLEFDEFEFNGLGFALRTLTKDQALVDRAESELDLAARLTLLKRVAFVRHVDLQFAGQWDHIQRRAARLCETRDNLTRAALEPAALQAGAIGAGPTLAELEDYRHELMSFQSTLRLLVQGSSNKQYSV